MALQAIGREFKPHPVHQSVLSQDSEIVSYLAHTQMFYVQFVVLPPIRSGSNYLKHMRDANPQVLIAV